MSTHAPAPGAVPVELAETAASDLSAPRSQRGVAVVTGGSAGLGRAVVRELAARGWDVAVLARGRDGLAGAVADVAAAGRRGIGVVCDVAHREHVEAAATRVEADLGPVEVWVNNAMASVFSPFTDTAPDDFERATAVTYFGQVHGTRAALGRMRPRDRGHVVQIGSALAFRGIPLQAAYCGAKHAVVGFTESVITELRHEGSRVQVSMVHMPGMNTTQFGWVRTTEPNHPQPVAPIWQPEACAKVVAEVVDHPRRRTWVGESTVYTVLGSWVAPWFVDRYLARTGVEGQLTGQPRSTMRGDYLDAPVAGDAGARGEFDAQSWSWSPQVWLQQRRHAVDAAGTAALALGAVTGAVAAVTTTARAVQRRRSAPSARVRRWLGR
ncbi:MAG: SDR family oxidoreductase [Quadrisphaera sp.]